MSVTSPPRPKRSLGPVRLNSLWFVYGAAAVILVVLVLMPTATVVLGSFGADGSFSLRWWGQVFQDREVQLAMRNTAIVVVASTVLSVSLGAIFAWLVKRSNLPGARFFDRMPILLMLFPPLLGGLGWVLLLGPRTGLLNQLMAPIGAQLNIYSLGGLVWVLSLYQIPWAYTILAAGMESLDSRLSEASRISGGGRMATLLRIEFPLMRPHLLASTILIVVLAMAAYTEPVLLGSVVRLDVLSVVLRRYATNWSLPSEYSSVIATLLLVIALVLTISQRRLSSGSRFVTVSGKGSESAVMDLGAWRWPFAVLLGLYFTAGAAAPVGALLIVSFQKYWGAPIVLSEMSFDNYKGVFESPSLLPSLWNSLWLGVVSAVIIICLSAISVALVLRSRIKGAALLDYLGMLSIAVPGIVFGLGVLNFFIGSPVPIYGTAWLLLLGYVGAFFGFAYRQADAALRQVDENLETAARVAGSNFYGVLFRVLIPIMRPGLAGAWLLVFILIFREFPLSTFLTSPGMSVLSVALFENYEKGEFTVISAFSIIVFLLMVAMSVVVSRIGTPRR